MHNAFSRPFWIEGLYKTFRDEVLMALGAGYYSYGKKKVTHYREARSRLGAFLGLIYGDKDGLHANHSEVLIAEEKLIPAISSLIKKMERKKY